MSTATVSYNCLRVPHTYNKVDKDSILRETFQNSKQKCHHVQKLEHSKLEALGNNLNLRFHVKSEMCNKRLKNYEFNHLTILIRI